MTSPGDTTPDPVRKGGAKRQFNGRQGRARASSRDGQQLDILARTLLALVAILVATTFVVYWPAMTRDFHLFRLADGPKIEQVSYFLFRLPREMMLVAVLAFTAYYVFFARRQYLTWPVMLAIALPALWVLLVVAYAISVRDLPAIVPLLGLRKLQFLPLLVAGYLLAREYGNAPALRFASFLRVYVALVLAIAAVQMIVGDPRASTVRPRALGAFASFNTFGATLVVCSLWFLWARTPHDRGVRGYLPWGIACLLGAVTTGSRTAIALCAVVLVCAFLPRGAKARWLWIAIVPLLMAAILLLASNPLLSGRPQVASSNTTRLEIYRGVVESLDTPSALMLGGGLGLYSSSTATLLGRDRFPGQTPGAHSTFFEILGGFGLGGLLIYCFFFAASAVVGPKPYMSVFLLIVAALSILQPLWGMFPADLLLLFLWGHLLGSVGHESSDPRGFTGPHGSRASSRAEKPTE